MRRPSPDRVGWRFLGRTLVILVLVAASASTLAVTGAARDASAGELDCAGGDGVVFRTDSGLEVVHDGRSVRNSPFVDETTLSFPNLTVRAADDASLTVASATERRVCVTDLAPTEASLVVAPAGGPAIVVADALDSLAYGPVDYARSETGADLAYRAPATAKIDVDVALQSGRVVQAVDVERRTVLDTGRVTENRTLALRLPGATSSVDLRLAPADNATETAGPAGNGTASAGDSSGPGSDATSTDTETPIRNGSSERSGDWTAQLVDYQPSPQTQHVGGFLPVTVLLWLLALWLLFTRDSRETKWLVLVLVIASVRATSDLLQVVIDGFVGVEASIAAINLLLELTLALSFLQFAAVYAGEARLRSRRAKLGLGALAVLGAASIVTNPIHGFVIADAEVAGGPFTYVTTTAGPGGWLLFAFNTALLVAGGGLVVRSLLASSKGTVRRPAAVIGSGLCLATAIGVLSRLDRGPVPGYDYTASGVNYFVLSTAITLTAYGLSRLKRTGQESVIADLEDPILVLDDAWTLVKWNAAAEGLLPGVAAGRSLDDLLGESLQRPAVGETTTKELSLPIDAATSGDVQDPATGTGGRENASGAEPADPLADGDGSPGVTGPTGAPTGRQGPEHERHFIAKATAVTTETNAVIGYAVQFADVTDIRRQTMVLESRNDQLGQFASAITRDLRTALTEAERHTEEAIWHLESAGEPAAVDRPRLSAWFRQIDGALDRMAAVIEDILDHARGSDLETDPQPVAFEDVVASAWETVERPGATLRVGSSGEITADSDYLRRVLVQLFRNAVEHGSTNPRSQAPEDAVERSSTSPPSQAREDSVEHGGEGVTVRVGLDDDGFYVADDGPGVSEDVRADLFEPGVSSTDEGSGLGLAIAAQRASAHGWEIAAETPREGARFVVTGCETAPGRNAPTEGSE